MKKNALLWLLTILWIAVGVVQAQSDYYPIMNGSLWSYSNEKYMTWGDTVIEGTTYMKVYRQENTQPFDFNMEEAQFFAAIRNDLTNRKVYGYLPAGSAVQSYYGSSDQMTEGQEVLLYDFGLSIGDTVIFYRLSRYGFAKECRATRVESVSVMVGWSNYSGIYETYSVADSTIFLSNGTGLSQIFLREESFPFECVWTEAIGGLYGFNDGEQSLSPEYGRRALLCFTDSIGNYFQTSFDFDNDPDDCFSNGFGGSILEYGKKQIVVSPNPVTDILNVSFDNVLKTITSIELFTMNGTPLRQQLITEGMSNIELYLGNLPSGIYLLKIKSIDGINTVKIIKL